MKVTPQKVLFPLAKAMEARGERLYLVGGAVRNALLGLPHSDLDVTGALLQEEVLALCAENGIHAVVMSTALGTLHIRLGDEIAEYTPFRGEGYDAGGAHRPAWVKFGVDMAADARRRDFTVNALYADCLTGEVVDPLGGLEDLKAKRLRQCAADTLHADALRLLRLVRFSGELGFSIDADTLASAKRHAPMLADIAPERRADELMKILLCDTKYGEKEIAVSGGELPPLPRGESKRVLDSLLLLEEIGAWEHLVPELVKGRGIEQRKDHHRFTILEHAFHAAACALPDRTLRMAALLHDIGKPACFAKNGNYYDHARIGEPLAHEALRALKYPKKFSGRVAALVGAHMYDIQGTAKSKTLRRFFAGYGREMSAQLIAVRESDVRGCGTDDAFVAEKWRELLLMMLTDGTPFDLHDLHLTGKDLMETFGIRSSKLIGQILDDLLMRCIGNPADNNRERLLHLAESRLRQARG